MYECKSHILPSIKQNVMKWNESRGMYTIKLNVYTYSYTYKLKFIFIQILLFFLNFHYFSAWSIHFLGTVGAYPTIQ